MPDHALIVKHHNNCINEAVARMLIISVCCLSCEMDFEQHVL